MACTASLPALATCTFLRLHTHQHFCTCPYYLDKAICHHIVQLAIHFRQAIFGFEPARYFSSAKEKPGPKKIGSALTKD